RRAGQGGVVRVAVRARACPSLAAGIGVRALRPMRASAVFAHNAPDLRLAWCGPSLLALGNDGTCRGRGPSGYFFREARFLSRFGLEVEGEPPACGSVASEEPHALEFSYLYPPVETSGGGGSGSGMSGEKQGLL